MFDVARHEHGLRDWDVSNNISTAFPKTEPCMSSDFLEAEPGGGPHAKVFDAATDAAANADAFFSELGRDTSDSVQRGEIEIVSWSWGETNEAGDTIPMDQLSINFAKIEYDN
jgi:hypothetical protein